jgi:hypothetical protein
MTGTISLRTHRRWGALAVIGLLAAGCSREPVPPPLPPPVEEATEAKPAKISTAKPAPTPAEVAPPPTPAIEKPPLPPAAVAHTIRVTALMKPGNAPARVGVVQDSTGYWRMLHVGQAFLGYRVKSIDYESETVTFDRQGATVELRLEGVVEKAVVSAETEKGATQAEAKLVRGKTNYAPSFDERARGIDPNDADTWPEGYRGPAIERIALEMSISDNTSFDPESARAAQVFEPTSDEISRGINPNDPDTWPKGYRGPAIERSLQGRELEDSGSQPQFDRTPPEGTPEEIKQRFFDTYGPKGTKSD